MTLWVLIGGVTVVSASFEVGRRVFGSLGAWARAHRTFSRQLRASETIGDAIGLVIDAMNDGPMPSEPDSSGSEVNRDE